MKRDAENEAYKMVIRITMTCKKIFLNTDQSIKSVCKGQLDGGAIINSVLTLANRINP